MAVNIHSIDETAAAQPPCPAASAPGDEPGKAGGVSSPGVSPAIPVTTERRTPGTRIQPGDRCRHVDGAREGLVTATNGFTATVQWTEGGEEPLAWGYIERVPSAVSNQSNQGE